MALPKIKRGTGDFFAIDRKAWQKAIRLGLNEGVAYLVLARGTAYDNKTTAWSVQAVETYTSISRPKAKKALQRLIENKLVEVLRAGTKPKYNLKTWSEIEGKEDSPEWIWLPNALVTGAGDEVPPVELLRQSQDALILCLFIDLYAAHDLAYEAGIPRSIIWSQYQRKQLGQQGPMTVWAFSFENTLVIKEAPFIAPHLTGETDDHGRDIGWDRFWQRWKALQIIGLVQVVPHLVEAAGDEAMIIHPYGMSTGEDFEIELGRLANAAGKMMITDGQYTHGLANIDNEFWLAPVPSHITDVQMVGIARLRYRPRTSMTGAWWAENRDNCETFTQRYKEIISRQRSQ